MLLLLFKVLKSFIGVLMFREFYRVDFIRKILVFILTVISAFLSFGSYIYHSCTLLLIVSVFTSIAVVSNSYEIKLKKKDEISEV
jgi:hypothetical protein